ncbi:MAG: hypothetical protein R1F52_03050 [Candidatus Nitrosoabyssus spongiisocia]|nr:MAG: hypothetical protein R1F52_03050 [Nitrosopumilaceae archaeon AB1(1)]
MSIKELELYKKIKHTGPFANETLYYEIPIGDWSSSRKRIDIVALKNQKLVSIEVKISNWKKVLQQAYTNLYVADYSYVALWHKTMPNVDISLFENLGIGILEINGSCEKKLSAKKSKLVISKRRRYAKKQCTLQEMS